MAGAERLLSARAGARRRRGALPDARLERLARAWVETQCRSLSRHGARGLVSPRSAAAPMPATDDRSLCSPEIPLDRRRLARGHRAIQHALADTGPGAMVEVPALVVPLHALERFQHRGEQQGPAQRAARRARAARSCLAWNSYSAAVWTGEPAGASRSIQVRSWSLSSRPSCDWTQIFLHRLAVAPVGEHDAHLAIAPFLAPLAQRQNDRQQRLRPWASANRSPLRLSAGSGVRSRIPPATIFVKTVGENVARDSESRLEFLEMLKAIERAAKDQERPFFADQLDRRRYRARQSRFLKPVDMRRQRVCRIGRFLPCRIPSKHSMAPKNSCELKLDKLFVSNRN